MFEQVIVKLEQTFANNMLTSYLKRFHQYFTGFKNVYVYINISTIWEFKL